MRRLNHFSWFRCLLMLLVLSLSVPMPVAAQEPVTLTVTLHDETGASLPGRTVTVVEATTGTVLAEDLTDAMGSVSFTALPPGRVRIQVAGRTADGLPLIQPGLDAQGIAFQLVSGSDVLHLRTQPDGLVLPDPATMIAPDALGVASDSVPLPLPTLVPAAPVSGRPVAQATQTPAQPEPALLLVEGTSEVPPVIAEPTPAQRLGRWILIGSALAAVVLAVLALRARQRSLSS